MPIYKRCSKCNKRIESGTICTCVSKRYREEDKYTKDDGYKRFYSSKSWKQVREQAISLYNGIDIYSLYVHGHIEFATTVHHIIPLREDWTRRLDNSNLIPLTDSNHQVVHDLMRKGDDEVVAKQLMEMKKLYEQESRQLIQ